VDVEYKEFEVVFVTTQKFETFTYEILSEKMNIFFFLNNSNNLKLLGFKIKINKFFFEFP